MHISIFGLGYVGSIAAGCLAHLEHTVTGLDANPAKTAQLAAGKSPVLEPGLDALIAAGCAAGRIQTSDDPVAAVLRSDLSLLCVGTPALADGSLDDRQLQRVIDQVGAACRQKAQRHLIVVRSTALPATHEALRARLAATGLAGDAVGYVVHPEFLREASGVADFFDPALILYGGATTADKPWLEALYPGLAAPLYYTDRATAALTKLAGNAFHAVKVAFANEVAAWAQAQGGDGAAVMDLLIADGKLNLGSAYLRPGLPFAGGCLPKDLAAAVAAGRRHGLALPLLSGAAQSNQDHGEALAARLAALPQQRVLLIGLAFKPGTDDLRESPLVLVARRLLDAGKTLRIYAPEIVPARLSSANLAFARQWLPELADLLTTDLAAALAAVEVILLGQPLEQTDCAAIRAQGVAWIDLTRPATFDQDAGDAI